jgi:hypothetical protein
MESADRGKQASRNCLISHSDVAGIRPLTEISIEPRGSFLNRAITLSMIGQISCEFGRSVCNHRRRQAFLIKRGRFCLAHSQVVPIAARCGVPVAGNSLSNRQIYSA